jgi:pimeloyl-ACP methyl ester carboxylesterase
MRALLTPGRPLPARPLTVFAALCLTLVAAAPAVAARRSAPRAPRIVLPEHSVTATDQFRWLLPIRIVNDLSVGFFNDSMVTEIEDLDRGATHAPRTVRLPVPALVKTTPSISAGDSAAFNYHSPAPYENARLTFRLYGHTGNGRRYAVSSTVEVIPGPVSLGFPSQFVQSEGRQVEMVVLPAIHVYERAPAVLLIHGEGSHARQLLARAWDLANKGYTVALVSQPGYGLSEGTPDLAGAATIGAAQVALDRLRRLPGVDSTRIGIWGISRGAAVAARLAAERVDLKAVIVQSGWYDLWATYRAAGPAFREAIVREAGPDSAAWHDRSPLVIAPRIQVPALVLHSDDDPGFPQARAFAASLRESGRAAEARFLPSAGAVIPSSEVMRVAIEFLDLNLKPGSRP